MSDPKKWTIHIDTNMFKGQGTFSTLKELKAMGGFRDHWLTELRLLPSYALKEPAVIFSEYTGGVGQTLADWLTEQCVPEGKSWTIYLSTSRWAGKRTFSSIEELKDKRKVFWDAWLMDLRVSDTVQTEESLISFSDIATAGNQTLQDWLTEQQVPKE